jgi:hypothetical protein
LVNQFLEAAKVRQGRLEIGDLFGGDVAGNIFSPLVTLVVVVGALGPLANDADRTPIHALDLGDLVKDGFGS